MLFARLRATTRRRASQSGWHRAPTAKLSLRGGHGGQCLGIATARDYPKAFGFQRLEVHVAQPERLLWSVP